jgi:VIT1/CCC1 family predicted Fe2+/Mn2+ transporter
MTTPRIAAPALFQRWSKYFPHYLCNKQRIKLTSTSVVRGGHMEKFILISQAVSLGVVFYVVIYFLIAWYWPATLLSVLVCTFALYFFIGQRGHAHRARHIDLVSAIAPDPVPVSLKQFGDRLDG